jgi:hypothetical protein
MNKTQRWLYWKARKLWYIFNPPYSKRRKKEITRSIQWQDYELIIEYYDQGKGFTGYSRGIVHDLKTGEILFDVKRNYSHFWYAWTSHSNGNKYMLCGADYQGQTVLNLTQKTRADFVPDSAKKGYGFCWIDVFPLGNELVVEGCYWACPYEKVTYDFSEPDKLPYKEISRCDLDSEWGDEYEL